MNIHHIRSIDVFLQLSFLHTEHFGAIQSFIASHFQMKFFPIKRAVLSTSVLLVDTLNQLMYDCEEKYFLEEKKENLIVSTFVLMFWCLNLENTSYVSNEKRRLALEVIYI